MAWGDEIGSEPFPNPQTPEEQAANEEWLRGFEAARAERDQEWAQQKAAAAASPTGEPKLDQIFTALNTGLRTVGATVAGGADVVQQLAPPPASALPLRMRRPEPKQPIYEPKVIPPSSAPASSIESDPGLAEQLDAELAGFPETFRGYLLDTYKTTKERGESPQEAHRNMMKARQDIMRGPAEMTGWSDFPAGLPTELFWERYLDGSDRAARSIVRYVFKDFVERGYQDAGLNAAEQEAMRQKGIQPGPMDGLSAFRALQEYEKVHWPQGRPRSQSSLLLGADIVTLMALPLLPIGFAIPVAGSIVASEALPENVPDPIRTAIVWGMFGIGGPGGMLGSARRAVQLGITAAAGGEAAKLAGAPPVAGEFIGPILAPNTARIALGHLAWLKATQNPKAVQTAMQKMVAPLAASDLGATVAIGDQLGSVTALGRGGLLTVTLDGGRIVTVPRSQALVLPGSGRTATIASEAARPAGTFRDEAPLQLSEGALQGLRTGPTVIHYTDPSSARAIMTSGFKPSPASRESYPGVYVTTETTRIAEAGDRQALFIDAPNGAVANSATAERIRARLAVGKDAEGNTAVMRELQSQGYVALDTRPGVRVYFDPAQLKTKLGADVGIEWSQFKAFGDKIMMGDTRAVMLKQPSGGAPVFPWGSNTLNAVADKASNNAYDRRLWDLAMGQAAVPKQYPGTNIGKVWTFAKSVVGINPGLRRALQPQVLAAAQLSEGRQALVALQEYTFYKGIGEAFGKEVVSSVEAGGAPLRHLWRGPNPTTLPDRGQAIGTLQSAAEHMDWYDLTPKQKDVLSWLQTLFSNNSTHLQTRVGLKFDLVEGVYMPLRRTEQLQSWGERLLAPAVSGGGLGAAGKPFFARHRKHQDIHEWTAFLQTQGPVQGFASEVEYNTFKLINQRLQAGARLEADQLFLQGVAKAHGQPIPTGRSAPFGWTEIGMGRLPARFAVPDAIAREVRSVLEPSIGDLTRRIEDAAQWFRAVLLSADGSFYTKQGYDVMTVDPARGIERFASAAALATSREGFMTWLAHNYDTVVRYTQAGGTFHISATDALPTLGKEAVTIPFTKIPLPVISTLNEYGYSRFLPMMKTMQWTSAVQLLQNLQADRSGAQAILSHLPVVGQSMAKVFRREAGLEGATIQEIERAAADMMNNVGGGVNWAKLMTRPDLWQSTIFLTPGWLRANVGRIVSAAKVGDPAGVLARRFLFQNVGISAMLSTFLSLQISGRLPNYDPTAPDWLDVQVGDPTDLKGGTIPILPDKTYIRTIFQAIAGKGGAFPELTVGPDEEPFDLKQVGVTGIAEIDARIGALFRFGEGRTGQIPRVGIDLARGRDIFGRKIDDKLLYTVRALLPIIGQGIADTLSGDAPPIEAGIGAFGLNWLPRNPYEARDNVVAADGGYQDEAHPDKLPIRRYSDLSDTQRREFDTRFPDYSAAVHRWQDERDSPYAAARAVRDRQRFAVEALGKAFQGQELSDEERNALGPQGAKLELIRRNPGTYRKMLGDLAVFYRHEAEKQSAGESDFAPRTASQEVVTNYYKDVIDASIVAGALDYDLFDENERAYRRTVAERYGDEGLRVLDEELLYRVSDDPVAAAYHRDQKLWEPYFNYLEAFWTQRNLVSAGLDERTATEAAEYRTQRQFEIALTDQYFELLVGKPLPSQYHNYKASASAKSIGERFGLVPGRRLTEQESTMVAKELVRIQMKGYSERIAEASDLWLKKDIDTFCAMDYWDIINQPTEALRPYVNLCPVRRFQ